MTVWIRCVNWSHHSLLTWTPLFYSLGFGDFSHFWLHWWPCTRQSICIDFSSTLFPPTSSLRPLYELAFDKLYVVKTTTKIPGVYNNKGSVFSGFSVLSGCCDSSPPQVFILRTRLREWPLPGTCHSHGRGKVNSVMAPKSSVQEYIHHCAHTPLTKGSHMVKRGMIWHEVRSCYK